MRLNISAFVLLASTLAWSTAQAEEVGATKTAPSFDSLLKHTGASTQYRHYYQVQTTGDELKSVTPVAQLRAYLDFKLFDNIDSTLILAPQKKAGTQQIGQRRPELWSSLTVLEAGGLTLNAYNDLLLPFGGAGTSSAFGIQPNGSWDLAATSVGEFKMSLDSYFAATFTSREEDGNATGVTESAKPGYTLVEEEGSTLMKANKDDPDYYGDATVLVNYTPSIAPKLTIGAGVNYNRSFEPVYKFSANGDVATSYTTTTTTANRIKLKYAASDAISVGNEFYQTWAGLYEERLAGSSNGLTRYYNYTTLTYKFY